MTTRDEASRVPDSGALQLVTLLRQALARGPITITNGDLAGLLGVTTYADRTVVLDQTQDDRTWYVSLVHELLHLVRGPVAPDQVQAEEEAVEHATASMLVRNASALARLAHRWTRPQMRILAAGYQVDLDTVTVALNPPTRPMLVVRPRHVGSDAVALAARMRPEAS